MDLRNADGYRKRQTGKYIEYYSVVCTLFRQIMFTHYVFSILHFPLCGVRLQSCTVYQQN